MRRTAFLCWTFQSLLVLLMSCYYFLPWTVLVVSQVLVVGQFVTPGSTYGSQTAGSTSAGSAVPLGSSGKQGTGPTLGAAQGSVPGQSARLGSGKGLGIKGIVGGQGVDGSDRFGQGGSGLRTTASSSGPAAFAGARYGSPQVSRVDAVFNPTVTQLVTIDRFVTLTDQAFQSVAVTLTSLTVQTVTAETRGVVQTPVDDRVALQTTVVVRPSTLTLTHVQSDFRIVTETALDYVTITHTSYVIMQTTYTTTATQVLSYATTLVRTNINTKSIAFTDYRTVTDTVLVAGGRYGYGQL